MNLTIADLPLTTYADLPDDGAADSLAVFFHGYGADGKDLFNLSPVLRRHLPRTAFYFPDAPETLGGTEGLSFFGGRQWFDLNDFNPSELYSLRDAESFCKGLIARAERARAVTESYLNAIGAQTGIPTSNIALCGFSQGGLMALYTALRHAERVACVVGMSAVATLFDGDVFKPSDVTAKPPVVLIHGDADNMVPPCVFGLNLINLAAMNMRAGAFLVPNLMHGIDDQALTHLTDSLKKFL